MLGALGLTLSTANEGPANTPVLQKNTSLGRLFLNANNMHHKAAGQNYSLLWFLLKMGHS